MAEINGRDAVGDVVLPAVEMGWTQVPPDRAIGMDLPRREGIGSSPGSVAVVAQPRPRAFEEHRASRPSGSIHAQIYG